MRTVRLNADRMKNRRDLHDYMEEVFNFRESAENLDALYDNLTEVNEETELILTPEETEKICGCPYSYKVLMVIGKAAEHNPNLHILFRQ